MREAQAADRAGRSLRVRVLLLALAAIGIAWAVAAAIAYQRVEHEADELLDGYLAQTAAILQAQLGERLDDNELEHAPALHRYARRLAFQVWDRNGQLRLHSANAPDGRMSAKSEGFDDVEIGRRRWRVFSTEDLRKRVLVQVAEERRVRNEIVASVGRALAVPLVVALPVIGVLLWLAVSAGIRPLRVLGREVAARDPGRLDPVAIDAPPKELAPLVDELNRLLGRVRDSLEHERRFTADAAHELRTPIAALLAQAQVARATTTSEVREHALDRIIAGCDRASRLVDQMLTLARLEPATGVPPDARCDLAEVARDVVAQAAPAAIDRGTEIELEAAPVTVRGDAALLAILLRNLVDNAVRYSPAGSSVRVAVARDRPEGVELVVTDSGPGVPAALRGRLGDRFFREGGIDASEGSGLGLSIVKRIATLHHASVEFDDGPGGRGLCVRVRFVGEVQRGTPR